MGEGTGFMKKTIAGPWRGELGWELMVWIPYLRRLAMDNDMEIIAVGQSDKFALYEDFVNKYVFDIETSENTDAWRIDGKEPELSGSLSNKYKHLQHIKPRECYKQKGLYKSYRSEYINKKDNLIIIHPRMTSKCGTSYRNWSKEKWQQLCDTLIDDGYTVVAIGTKKSAFCPDGCVDKLGCNSDIIIELMTASSLVVGPSSGPMHLASLCEAPHLVWTDQTFHEELGGTNRDRYEKIWNPLNTDVTVIDSEGWQPSVDTIYDGIKEKLNG